MKKENNVLYPVLRERFELQFEAVTDTNSANALFRVFYAKMKAAKTNVEGWAYAELMKEALAAGTK